MIKTKEELREYMQADALLYPKVSGNIFLRLRNYIVTTPQSTQHYVYSYIVNLRYAEYHENNSILNCRISFNACWHTLMMLFRYWKLRKLSYITGIQIDPSSFGKGLQIWHYGSIIVNRAAKIGDYATIYPGVVIGAKKGKVPIIGNNVFIGAGAKILGGVKICDNVIVAPNAVVVKDVPANCIVAGVPAKIIKRNENPTN